MPITATPEDARLLFHRWQQESARVAIKLRSHTLFFQGTGTVTAASPGVIEVGGHAWTFSIPLEDVIYSFSDPREIPVTSVRQAESAKYELGLSLTLPNGDELVLLELKNQKPASDDDE